MIEEINNPIKTIYMRPDMSIIEAGAETHWLYDTFGDPNEITLRMNIETFEYLLKRINCYQNARFQILAFDKEYFVYGYRVMINNRCPENYIYITNLMAEYI